MRITLVLDDERLATAPEIANERDYLEMIENGLVNLQNDIAAGIVRIVAISAMPPVEAAND